MYHLGLVSQLRSPLFEYSYLNFVTVLWPSSSVGVLKIMGTSVNSFRNSSQQSGVDYLNGQRTQKLKILSYNVLAQFYIRIHKFELYSSYPEHVLDWNKRSHLLLDTIASQDPDVVCLQEVEEQHYLTFFSPRMESLGFSGKFLKRRCRPDGLAVFYRKNMFYLLKFHPIYLDKGVRHMNGDNVAAVLILEPIVTISHLSDFGFYYPSYEPIVIVTTHLLFTPQRGDVKLAQLAVIFSEIDAIAKKKNNYCGEQEKTGELGPWDYYPIVFCGDMNFQPHCPLFNFVTRGSLYFDQIEVSTMGGSLENIVKSNPSWRSNTRKLCKHSFDLKSIGITENCLQVTGSAEGICSGTLSHKLGLKSSYHMEEVDDNNNYDNTNMTTHHEKGCCTLDFIFFNESSSFSLVDILPIPKTDFDKEMIPNGHNGSDHYPVAATFVMTAKEKFHPF